MTLQEMIAAFVDSLRPQADFVHQLYYSGLDGFANATSSLLTLLGFPPVE